MENSALEAMTFTLEAKSELSGLDADSIFKCLEQVIEDSNSTIWSKLQGHISKKIVNTLHNEIIELMKGVKDGWAIKVDMESSYDDQGSQYNYPEDPYLNDDIFPVNMSGDLSCCGDEFEEEWLPKYPSLTIDVLESLVYKLEVLFDEMNQGFTLSEDELRTS